MRVQNPLIEPFRIDGPPGTNNGRFSIYHKDTWLKVISTDGEGWEHVSVSTEHRCPTWEEMCYIKELFWKDSEAVMQLHPRKSDWVNYHPYCLHLWRPLEGEIPLPPPILVGPTAVVAEHDGSGGPRVTPRKGFQKCPDCGGHGYIDWPNSRFRTTCATCDGKGGVCQSESS